MRVLLVNAPAIRKRAVSRSMMGGLGFGTAPDMILPPLDLALMASVLRSRGHEVSLMDPDALGLDDDTVLSRAKEIHAERVVTTVSLPTLENDTAFARRLREETHVSLALKTFIQDETLLAEMLRTSGAEKAIIGEPDLLAEDVLLGRTSEGTAWLEDSHVQKVPFRPVENLDVLPFPARDLLPNSAYGYPLLGTGVTTLQTSRGCPYSCSYYCPYPLVEGKRWRSQSPSRVVGEMVHVVRELGIRKILFRDATFTLNRRRTVEICRRICEENLDVEWWCETRADCLDENTLIWMRRAGCRGINVGVETGDERIMHTLAKDGLTLDLLARVRRKAAEIGVKMHFLLQVGLPGETRRSIVETYDLLDRLRPDSIGVCTVTPYPGTPLHEEAVRRGWIQSRDWNLYSAHHPVMRTETMTIEEMEAGSRFLQEGFRLIQKEDRESRRTHYISLVKWACRLESEANVLHRRVRKGLAVSTSVVIPTVGRAERLQETLKGYDRQSLRDPFEVIIVVDGEDSAAVQGLKESCWRFDLTVLQQPHAGPGQARNRGFSHSQGTIVLFTGDDIIPAADLLARHQEAHARHPKPTDAVLGRVEWDSSIEITSLMRFVTEGPDGFQFGYPLLKGRETADVRFFYTSNLSLKRSFLARQTKLFDRDFPTAAWEDIELGRRLSEQGMTLYYEPSAVGYHRHPYTLEGFLGRMYRSGRSARVFLRKHPDFTDLLAFDRKAFEYREEEKAEKVKIAESHSEEEAYRWLILYEFHRGFHEERRTDACA